MAVIAAIPLSKAVTDGVSRILTFVVPAPSGCDLACPFCFIRARGEQRQDAPFLSIDNYVAFAQAVIDREPISILAIQGYEALLPESWPHTRALLSLAADSGVESSMVTNGTHLAERVDDLIGLGISSLTVSVDSADAATHDSARGVVGAFARTERGLRAVSARPELRDRTLVASVMQPRRHEALLGMPDFLAGLGLSTWIIQPTFKVGVRSGRLVEEVASLVPSLKQLHVLAKRKGVRMVVEDELGVLVSQGMDQQDTTSLIAFEVRKLNALARVIRLSPNGDVAIGSHALTQVNGQIRPVWLPDREPAEQFVQRILRRHRLQRAA